MRPSCGPIDGNNHFFQQSTQQLFAIVIRGGRRRPDFVEISTERADLFFLLWAECAGPLLISTKSGRSEEHTSELQSRGHLVCRLLLEKKKKINKFYCQYRH